jgi:hypothetical protein
MTTRYRKQIDAEMYDSIVGRLAVAERVHMDTDYPMEWILSAMTSASVEELTASTDKLKAAVAGIGG